MKKKYPFSYRNEKLDLYPNGFDTSFLKRLLSSYERGKTINHIDLHGVIAADKNIIFEVSEQYSDQDGFLSFRVFSVYEYEPLCYHYCKEPGQKDMQERETKIRGIKIHGTDINWFYPPEKAYFIEYSKDGSYRAKVSVKEIDDRPLGKIEWEGTEIVATFSTAVTLDFVKQVYFAMYQTFRYLTRRNNIVFDRIKIFDLNESNLRYEFGTYYDFRKQYVQETHEKVKSRVLSYDYIQEKFSDLLKLFLYGKIYIGHLPDCIDNVNTFGPDRMLFDFVAFEREFGNLYPEESLRSEHYLEAKHLTLEALDGMIEQRTGKVKKYLTSFRKRIAADENSLADRLLVAIKDCKLIMKPFLIYEPGKDYDIEVDGTSLLEDITSKMNTLRNDIAHGNLDIKLDKQHIFGFSIIETLLYVMRLKNLGIEEKKFKKDLYS